MKDFPITAIEFCPRNKLLFVGRMSKVTSTLQEQRDLVQVYNIQQEIDEQEQDEQVEKPIRIAYQFAVLKELSLRHSVASLHLVDPARSASPDSPFHEIKPYCSPFLYALTRRNSVFRAKLPDLGPGASSPSQGQLSPALNNAGNQDQTQQEALQKNSA